MTSNTNYGSRDQKWQDDRIGHTDSIARHRRCAEMPNASTAPLARQQKADLGNCALEFKAVEERI